MEKQIKKLVELAEKYCELGQNLNFRQGWTCLDHDNIADSNIRVYFAENYRTKSVVFFNTETTLYSSKISMPFNCTTKDLDEIIKKTEDFYTDFVANKQQEFKHEQQKLNEKRILELEEELNRLKTNL